MTTTIKKHVTIPDRTLVNRGSTKGILNTEHLESVRDYLRRLEERQQPIDFERSLDQLLVDFTEGRLEACWMTPNGENAQVFRLTTNGANQLSRDVLPSRFFSGLKQLACMDDRAEKLASLVWRKFASNRTDIRKVRTIRMRVDGDVHRVIRSCHSQGYATYSNLQFVQDILDNAGGFSNLPVLSWRVTDSGMRLRFAGIDPATAAFAPLDPDILLTTPIPMIEGWNSETGRRRVVLRGGMWKLICTNGMGSWNDRSEYNWIHRGDPSRIRRGVEEAFLNITTEANGVVEAYNEACNIDIDDAYAWMLAEMPMSIPNRVVIAAKRALIDPTTTPGGTLASVVDALTLVAQEEEDIFAQYDIEREAAVLLKKGRAIALNNNGCIPA